MEQQFQLNLLLENGGLIQRKDLLASVGTLTVPISNCNGTIKITGNGIETHGTSCASQAYGRQYVNANKWYLNLYGGMGINDADGFDMLFHENKHNTKNPTISTTVGVVDLVLTTVEWILLLSTCHS